MKARVWPLLKPFQGPDVRRLVAFITLAVALPRLPGWPAPPSVAMLGLLPPEAFGWLTLMGGIALLATMGSWRLKVQGRLVALFSFVVWAALAAATMSVTSLFIDLLVMYALLGEIMALPDDC